MTVYKECLLLPVPRCILSSASVKKLLNKINFTPLQSLYQTGNQWWQEYCQVWPHPSQSHHICGIPSLSILPREDSKNVVALTAVGKIWQLHAQGSKIKNEIHLFCAFNALKAVTWVNLTTEGLHSDISTLWLATPRTSKGSTFTLRNALVICFVCHSTMQYILCALTQTQSKALISSLALTWRPKDLHKTP